VVHDGWEDGHFLADVEIRHSLPDRGDCARELMAYEKNIKRKLMATYIEKPESVGEDSPTPVGSVSPVTG